MEGEELSRLKAIETHYRGFRFRSRLEARWAVCFDHMGLDWNYEEEGFELPSGRYLPDFVVRRKGSSLKTYVEIKPDKPDHKAKKLCFELAQGLEKDDVLFLFGAPGADYTGLPYYTHTSFNSLVFYGYKPGRGWPRDRSFFAVDLPAFLVSNKLSIPPAHTMHDDEKKYISEVIEADRLYYREKYKKEHPFWEYGVTEESLFFDKNGKLFSLFGENHVNDKDGLNVDMIEALNAGRAARFEYGEAG